MGGDATVEVTRVEDARVEAARVEAGGEAAGGEVALEEESTCEQQGKVARREDAARVKKLKAKEGIERKKAAKLEANRVSEAARIEAGGEANFPRINCCLKCVLSREPDFLEQN
mmetsp:Transcript_23633/g.22761  ORF Transcript_23633/g.22761 Transcript_23633/m.22761 type:complete len:114 (+) Transcript_23633:383-724(+)